MSSVNLPYSRPSYVPSDSWDTLVHILEFGHQNTVQRGKCEYLPGPSFDELMHFIFEREIFSQLVGPFASEVQKMLDSARASGDPSDADIGALLLQGEVVIMVALQDFDFRK